jgi:hypothetical protein
MNAHRIGDREVHLAPFEVRRRIVRVIAKCAREKVGLPLRVRDPAAAFARKLRSWRRRAWPLF